MIDTISINIGSAGFKFIVPFLKRFTSDVEFWSDEEQINNPIQKVINIRAKYGANNRQYVKTRILNGSRNYALKATINIIQQSVNLEWSVPKWIHGTNVHEFIDYSDVFSINYETQFSWVKEQLRNHIFEIINMVSDNSIDRFITDIQIIRIDFCKNLFFNSEDQVNEFHDIIKNRRKKYAKKDGDYREYGGKNGTDTSMTITDAYSVKFYKKGSEMSRDAYVFSMQKNKALKELSKRILRYEYTMRNQKMSYLVRKFYVDSKPDYMPESSWYGLRYKFRIVDFTDDYNLNFFDHLYIFLAESISVMHDFIPSTTWHSYKHYFEILENLSESTMKNTGKKLKTGKIKTVLRLLHDGKTFKQLIDEGYISKSGSYEIRKRIQKYLGIDIQRITFQKHVVDLDFSNSQLYLRSNNLL